MNYTDWQINVFKGLSEKLGTTNFEVGILIKQYNNKSGEDILDILYTSGESYESSIEKLMVLKPKFQVRGIFTLKSKLGITDTVLSFCIDLDITYYEGQDLIKKGRNNTADINLVEIIESHIDTCDSGINKADILVITMELWCNQLNEGWFTIK
jgi:hypothetical protein